MAEAKYSAWWFLGRTCLISCLLFVANQPVVAGLYYLLSSSWPTFSSQGARQFTIFVGPVLLLFLEWWLIDLLFWSRDAEQEED